jgi:hypothetical protein
VQKLEKAKVIREVVHTTWEANFMVVPKPNGAMRMCIDFTDLNKACPKDPFLLPRIDQIMDSTAGFDLLCFLVVFSCYNQIKMAVDDEENMVFITLKNVRATFQQAMRKCLGTQIGCNVEAYIVDIVVKSRSKETLIDDLHETFANLCKVQLKLNPEKCTFGVPSRSCSATSCRTKESKPTQTRSRQDEIQAPRRVKDIQRLNGCITALGCFISRLGECTLPFFKLLKRPGLMQWTPKADAVL